jgi:hypothetical protein
VTWWATPIEVRGALIRLHREGIVSRPALQASWERLSGMLSASRCIEPVEIVRELALAQLDRFPLKAGDALQLAAALVWCRQRPHSRLFICNDRRLRSAAYELGFEVAAV